MWYYAYTKKPRDVIIEVEGVQLEAHREVLSELSPYFSAMFERWSNPSKLVYTIPGVAPNIMRSIIQYAYSKRMKIKETNVQDLLVAADYLLVSVIVKRCCLFLEKRLCPENCREIFQFADMLSLDQLRTKSLRIINISQSNPNVPSTSTA